MLWLLLLILAVTLLYVYLKRTFTFWERKGFPTAAVNIPFGALDPVRRNKRSFGLAIYDVYKTSTEPVVGIYLTLRPALLVRDAQLAHDMLVKDFANFHDRGVYVDEKHDPISAGLFAQEGSDWRATRNKLSPSFSSGKLKGMFCTSEATADKMMAYLNSTLPQTGAGETDMKKLMSSYAIDIVASTIFGLEVDSFQNPNNELIHISKELSKATIKNIVRGTTSFLYPGLERIFCRLGWAFSGSNEMRSLVHRTIAYREENKIERRDLMQLLLQLRNTGQIHKDDDVWSANKQTGTLKSLTKDNITAQMFLFFAAGFETTASTAAFTLYELMQNPDILEKLKEDINKTLEKHDGKLTYDSIQDMKYLELCVMETARKYPALPLLNRICTKEYQLPGTNKTIEKGTQIIFSLFGMHRDGEYFPEPLRYNPDRFTDEQRNFTPAAYMPFGEGPRQCIAARMGKLNVKIAVTKILTNYDLETREDKREIDFTVNGIPLLAKGGVPVRLTKKQHPGTA
ncbi:hypothetical protein KR222_000257 [Zaprionus bogoriensis]|nr:hypothetical protein KR222_000257 [Zaprionus bogoriensis]